MQAIIATGYIEDGIAKLHITHSNEYESSAYVRRAFSDLGAW